MKDLIELKQKLYILLLCKKPEELTVGEVSIMVELSKDKDIQRILNKEKEII